MAFTRFAAATMAVLITSAPAMAAMHTIIILNPEGSRVFRFSVQKSTVIDFQPTNATEFQVKIDLPPEAYCNPIVRVTMGDGERIEKRVSICQDQGFTIRSR